MFEIYEYLFQRVYFYHTEHSSRTYMHIFVWSLVSRSSFNEFPFRLKPLWNKRTSAARHRVGKSIDSFVNGPGKSFWFQVFSNPLIESFQEGRFFEVVTSATVALKWQKHSNLALLFCITMQLLSPAFFQANMPSRLFQWFKRTTSVQAKICKLVILCFVKTGGKSVSLNSVYIEASVG